MLFDDDRKHFTNAYDQRLGYLTSLSTMLKSIDIFSASNKTRILELTTDTSNTLYITLNGIVKLITLFLKKIKYVFTVEFQNDRTEGEFRIHRQFSGGNYHISVQQMLTSLTIQRLKLFNVLNLKQNSSHHHDSCSTESLGEHEAGALNKLIEKFSKVN